MSTHRPRVIRRHFLRSNGTYAFGIQPMWMFMCSCGYGALSHDRTTGRLTWEAALAAAHRHAKFGIREGK